MSTTEQSSQPLDAEAELAALKEKTANWKKMVKAQLDDAKAKNSNLLEENAKLRDQTQTVASDTRLQLTAEFKDRLALKDDEIGHYRQEYEKLKSDFMAATKQHTEQLQTARNEAKQQYESLQQESTTIQGNLRKEMELEATLRDGLKKRIAQYEEQLTSLKTELMEVKEKRIENSTEQQAEEPTTKPESPTSPSTTSSGIGMSAEVEATLVYLKDREQQLVAAVAQKEEQCLVLQGTVRSLQLDGDELRNEIAKGSEKVSEIEEKNSQRLSKLTSELLKKHEEVSASEALVNQLQTEVGSLQNRLEELRAEATVREAAFDEWFQSEQGEKGAMIKLEADLKTAQNLNASLEKENEEFSEKVQQLEEEFDSLRKDHAEKEADLQAAERALAAKTERLKVQEERVRQKQQELSDQAAQFLGKMGGGDGGESKDSSSINMPSGSSSSSSSQNHNPFMSEHSFISAIHDQYRKVMASQKGQANFFNKYRRWWPAVAICFFLLMVWFRIGQGGAAVKTSNVQFSETELALNNLRREYDSLLKRCGAAAGGVSIPPLK